MNLSTLPDEELLNQFKQDRNPDFFAELFRRHESHVLKKCYRHLKDEDDAKDVSQEVFVRLFTKSHTYQPNLPFEPWLNRIISNRCTDHIKQDKTELHEEISRKIVDNIEEEIDTEEVNRPTVEILEELLERVDGEDKLILLQKYRYGWSIKQIAQSLKLNENTVKSRLKRTREELQRLLIRYSNSSFK